MSTSTTENFPVHLEFLKYGALRGGERSGAYLFLPDGIAVAIQPPPSTTVLVTTGNLESSVATGLPFVVHENIFRTGEKGLEIRNLVDIGDMSNTEIIMRMSTGIDSKEIFYTDLNAFEYIKRKRFAKLPIQANYYPIPSGIYIGDDAMRLTLLTAQPLGGSSLASGEVCLHKFTFEYISKSKMLTIFLFFIMFQIEIMQDRRLDQDDNRGLGQGVQDNVPILNIFKLGLENIGTCVKRSEKYRGGYLTSTMHTEANRLLHPMEKLVWYDNEWVGVQPQFGADRWSLDTGTEIAVLRNLKYVPTNANKRSTMGLVVNRAHLEQCDGVEKPSEIVRFKFSHLLYRPKKMFKSQLFISFPYQT